MEECIDVKFRDDEDLSLGRCKKQGGWLALLGRVCL